ncbi:SIR2 family protein [Rhizobium redzepovicii]|uniref:SIR2 family protein n=1 Tax=Rhizobium redzepovicii TaxID=2867518 RepID=A0AAW8PC58_9HYPH|nr:SIR2 family protein [Rhizobium redzepovicii]MDR9763754.1 SIR2 family protein [Rhizobium redzepovicii]
MSEGLMLQSEFISIFCERPAQFAWFLGAGTSRTAGLPTAGDVIWDLKRRYYRLEQDRDVSPQDIQNEAVRTRIQAFLDSQGFPPLWADEEYTTYFEKIFGEDRERQRNYLKGILSEDKVTLSVGNRVLGGLMAAGFTRAVFTTNFDSVVEKAIAEVGGSSLQAYSLEGTGSALNAIQNEEFPFYCKLHGDFRFESLKNLSADLATQNEALSKAVLAGGSRFGLVVAGYSGRDASIMSLLAKVLEAPTPFPHGLYWTGLKGASPHPAVESLLGRARAAGVKAEFVEIETFDALMSRVWRNIDRRPAAIDAKVRKSRISNVNIPMPPAGNKKPILRLNALPITLPDRCLQLDLKEILDWRTLRAVVADYRRDIIVTKAESVWCWGEEADVRQAFGNRLKRISEANVPQDFHSGENLHYKAFFEEAVTLSLASGKPLVPRMKPSAGFLIADGNAVDVGALAPLQSIVGRVSGRVSGLFSPIDDDHPDSEPVSWAEALRVSLDAKDGRTWLLLEPDVWIWPPHARKVAAEFLEGRKSKRFNGFHNQLLNAWTEVALGTSERNVSLEIRPFGSGTSTENPAFQIGTRTAFAMSAA